jgi:hypothetical protein
MKYLELACVSIFGKDKNIYYLTAGGRMPTLITKAPVELHLQWKRKNGRMEAMIL